MSSLILQSYLDETADQIREDVLCMGGLLVNLQHLVVMQNLDLCGAEVWRSGLGAALATGPFGRNNTRERSPNLPFQQLSGNARRA
jgi:hypothetical protein